MARSVLPIVGVAVLLLQRTCGMPTTLRPAPEVVTGQVRSSQAYIHDDSGNDEMTACGFNVPSRYESTVLARRLLALSSEAYISTNFPHHLRSSSVPAAVHDTPIALPDYIASCEEPTGNPTILALTVSTFMQNALAGSNVSIAMSWWDEYIKRTHKEPWSRANLPRISLLGHLENIPLEEADEKGLVECFTAVHGDSKWWLPGEKSSPHAGTWVRLVVDEVYWLGGFGDRNYIGWLDPIEWRNVTAEEWQAVRLPGEES